MEQGGATREVRVVRVPDARVPDARVPNTRWRTPRGYGARRGAARARPRGVTAALAALVALAALASLGGPAAAQQRPGSHPPLPFAVGEQLHYRVTAGRFGKVGRGTMSVEGLEEVRGQPALRLRFAIRGRVGFVRVANTTESWVDPQALTSLRFSKKERQFLGSHREQVEIFPATREWHAGGDDAGARGTTPTDAPLDELSFIYFLRTLALDSGATYSVSRHFQAARNPVAVSVLGRETVTTPAGVFATVLVEMRVKDAHHYEREGVIRLNFTDDEWRIPVRIATSMPVVGTTVLTLEGRPRVATMQ